MTSLLERALGKTPQEPIPQVKSLDETDHAYHFSRAPITVNAGWQDIASFHGKGKLVYWFIVINANASSEQTYFRILTDTLEAPSEEPYYDWGTFSLAELVSFGWTSAVYTDLLYISKYAVNGACVLIVTIPVKFERFIVLQLRNSAGDQSVASYAIIYGRKA